MIYIFENVIERPRKPEWRDFEESEKIWERDRSIVRRKEKTVVKSVKSTTTKSRPAHSVRIM